MADSDSESIPTSDEATEEPVEEVDAAVEMARRRAELQRQQAATPPPEKPKVKRVDPRSINPYDMLPERYRGLDSRPGTATSSRQAISRPTTAGAMPTAIVAPISEDVFHAPRAVSNASSPKAEEKDLSEKMRDLEAMVSSMVNTDAGTETLEAAAAALVDAPAPVFANFSAQAASRTDDLELDPAQLANLIDKDDDMVDASRYQSATGAKFRGSQYWQEKLAADEKFDLVSGVLEEMVESDEKFHKMQTRFKDRHCGVFEDEDENKLEYTTIHKAWVENIEAYIEKLLKKKVKGFQMSDFLRILEERNDEVSGVVWKLLLSFTEFLHFKEMMLNWKAGLRDEPTEVELSRTELAAMMNLAQDVMDTALDKAYEERQQDLADAAVSNALGF